MPFTLGKLIGSPRRHSLADLTSPAPAVSLTGQNRSQRHYFFKQATLKLDAQLVQLQAAVDAAAAKDGSSVKAKGKGKGKQKAVVEDDEDEDAESPQAVLRAFIEARKEIVANATAVSDRCSAVHPSMPNEADLSCVDRTARPSSIGRGPRQPKGGPRMRTCALSAATRELERVRHRHRRADCFFILPTTASSRRSSLSDTKSATASSTSLPTSSTSLVL